jgi:hypothetical protein
MAGCFGDFCNGFVCAKPFENRDGRVSLSSQASNIPSPLDEEAKTF